MRITLKKLEKAKACARERKRFARLFPNGCELNEKNLRRWAKGKRWWGIEDGLYWLVDNLFGVGTGRLHDTLVKAWPSCNGREDIFPHIAEFFKRELAKRKRRKK